MPKHAIYSLPDLASVVGLSRWSLRRLLENAGVEIQRNGRLRLVYISSIHQALPELWTRVTEGLKARDALDARAGGCNDEPGL